ncbi:MAG: aspartate/methionine/tyrosine aminotransferase [Verrucomicrobiales bacterium]|jgi:aspartate/methionine/tyrosine aminotransferase
MAEIASHPEGSRYGPIRGLKHLREALLDDLLGDYGGDLDVDDICITSGCNQAFSMVVSALCEPGDDVILPLPYYFNHDMWLGLDGLKANYLRPGNGVTPLAAEAEALIGDRTRAIVLVTPGNPTGHTMEPARLAEFARLAKAHDIVLIIDETYRSFVPGDRSPHNIFTIDGWRENVVSLHSFSKDLAIPGNRVGAVVGAPELLTEVAKLIDCVTICPSRIGQEGAHAGLTEAGAWRAEKIAEIAEKQAGFESVMSTRPGGFELLSAGAYYGWVRHPFADVPTTDIVERLLVEQGVLTIPGVAFMPEDEQMIRFSFANTELERLDELGYRLAAFSNDMGLRQRS